MPALDHSIAHLGGGHTLVVVLAVALLLGLRHATDPDHLAAVSTLIASEPEGGARRAVRLGLAWGLGHAITLFACGLPIVLFNAYLPDAIQRGAEFAVGLIVVALAVRLLVTWRRGHFHAHLHSHGDVQHRHLHPHGHGPHHAHTHEPEARLGRSPRQACAIGLVHGVGGSAGVGVLLLAGIPGRAEAVSALLLFALAAAASMTALSSGLGYALTREPVVRRALTLAPGLSFVTLAFGLWYAAAAISGPG
jgi:ABC-type nickel/cobalt efflux system permease component RcnA